MAFTRRKFSQTHKLLKYKTLLTVIILGLFNPFNLTALTFKVASYNVENLFDLKDDKREYPEYMPYTGFKWDNATYAKKLEHIAKVLCDLDAHIVGLQEIESETALNDLITTIKNNGCKDYKYYGIVKDKKEIPVRAALISVFPIIKKRDIKLPGDFRDILQTEIDVNGKRLIIFVNHWKSKIWPEKHRIVFAKRLMKEVKKLKKFDDYIMLGDFNSNYDEFKTIKYNYKLNNTKGLTGINHILRTVSSNQLIDKFTILEKINLRYHYNLWLEIDKYERFSYIFKNRRETPDHIILSSSLFDDINISYVDRSFKVFKPPYLFNDNKINRWQRAKSGKAWHLGEGYSDHLPIYAYFTDKPFKIKDDYPSKLFKNISDLYNDHKGKAIIKNAAIIYKYKNNCVIKKLNDKAIYCYNCLDNPKLFNIYDLLIYRTKKYKGLMEITSANIINVKGSIQDVEKFYIECNENTNYINNINEICSKIEGTYKDGYLYLGKQIIRLHLPKNIKIENNKKIRLEKVRIGFFKEPEIFVDEFNQVKNGYKD